MKKTLLFVLLALLLPLVANAYDFESGGIYYNFNSDGTSVTVTYKTTSYNSYSGSVVIPSTVTYNDTEYSVTSIGNYAFSGCSGLTSVTIGNSVTSIGNYAFNGCSGLTSVTIGNSVTSIGGSAFNGCSGLTSVTIPNSVTSIVEKAFYNCSGLTSISIPNSVTSIGSSAFYGTAWYKNQPDGLVYAGMVAYKYKGTMATGTKITLEEGTLGIGGGAFNGCSGLTSVTIPNSVRSIGGSAFNGCSGLTSVTIPNSVTSIGDDAFYGCSGLTSVTLNANDIVSKTYSNSINLGTIFGSHVKEYVLGDDVKGIGEVAFYNCTGLTSVTIGNSVTSIEGSAFYNCTGLTSVTIPNSVISIGGSAFSGCSGLTSVTIPNSVTSIGNYAFSRCSRLTSVTIPNSVTSIGNYAFNGCSGLTSVTIGNSVTSIGGSAFNGCSGLTSVTIPNSVTSIGDRAFYNCSGLTSITIPNSVTSIGYEAFSSCSGLTSVTLNSNSIVSKTYTSSSNLGTIFGSQVKEYVLGDDVKGIGNYAFYNCTGMTSMTIPNSVTSIGDGAFYGCTGLTSIDIPNSVTSIGSGAFSGCSGLTSVTIPNSVTSIRFQAFFGCSGLTSVTIPNSVTSIGGYAFDGCSGLTSVTIPNSVTSIGSYAFYDTAWYNNQPDGLVYAGMIAYKYKGTMATGTKITLEEGTLGIGGGAFRGCSGLTSITIPNSVTSIGDYAFEGCSGLTSVTIPNSVTSIGGGYTFSGCPLQTIVNRGDNDINKSTFSDRVYLHTQLYVPEGTVWDYIFNTGWGEFHNIREFANNADNIRNNAVYLIADHSGRNFPVYDRATKSLKNVAYTLNLDDNDAGACWRIVKDGSDTYLYNIGAGMYAAYDVENKLSLSIAPSAVDIKVTKEGTMINGKPAMLVVNKSVTPEPTFILGDANGNGKVEIGDVTSVLTLMATPDATGYDNKAADANGNGEIEIGDVTTILTIMAGE